MIKERLIKWAEALESGKYKQASGFLRRKNHFDGPEFLYCCLGVACEVFREETGEGEWRDNVFMGNSFVLPDAVADFFGFNRGLHDGTMQLKMDDPHMACWQMNDTEGAPFPHIAQYIRELAEKTTT